jgi:hypothetical protein
LKSNSLIKEASSKGTACRSLIAFIGTSVISPIDYWITSRTISNDNTAISLYQRYEGYYHTFFVGSLGLNLVLVCTKCGHLTKVYFSEQVHDAGHRTSSAHQDIHQLQDWRGRLRVMLRLYGDVIISPADAHRSPLLTGVYLEAVLLRLFWVIGLLLFQSLRLSRIVDNLPAV